MPLASVYLYVYNCIIQLFRQGDRMIYGIGCDILEINRIKNSCQSERFLKRVFSPQELEAFGGNHRKLASCFSAKEAFSKALGTGIRGFSLADISVLRDSLGKPYFVFSGNAEKIVREKELTAFITISNTETTVMTVAVLEGVRQ